MGDSELKNIRVLPGFVFGWNSKVLIKCGDVVVISEGEVTSSPCQFEKGDMLYIRGGEDIVLKFVIEKANFKKIWSLHGYYLPVEGGMQCAMMSYS